MCVLVGGRKKIEVVGKKRTLIRLLPRWEKKRRKNKMHVSFYDCDTPYSPTCTGDNKGNGLGCLCLVSSPEKVSVHLFSRGIFRFKKLWNLWNFLFHSSALVFFPPKKKSPCAFSDWAAGGREIRRIRVRSWRAFFLSTFYLPRRNSRRDLSPLCSFPFLPSAVGGRFFPRPQPLWVLKGVLLSSSLQWGGEARATKKSWLPF